MSTTGVFASTPLIGSLRMRIIDWKQLKELQPYSRQHIARLEKAGKWPKRVQLGPNRVGWVYDEVEAKLSELVSLRDAHEDTPA